MFNWLKKLFLKGAMAWDGRLCRKCGLRNADHVTGFHGCSEEDRIYYWRHQIMGWRIKGNPNCNLCNGTGRLYQPNMIQQCTCLDDKVDLLTPPARDDDHPCSGLAALCERCFAELTPEERLPYYEEILKLWYDEFKSNELRRMVLMGR
jgi:hypothetical protein